MKVPEEIGELMKKKYYLAASQSIMSNLTSIREPEFKEIKALNDIRDKLELTKGVYLFLDYLDYLLVTSKETYRRTQLSYLH